MRVIFSLLFFFSYLLIAAQQRVHDSLLNVIKTTGVDTIKISALNELGWQLKFRNPDSSIILSTKALKMAEVLPNSMERKSILMARCFRNLGVFNTVRGNYPIALEFYLKALKIYETINDEAGIRGTTINIGNVYYSEMNYPKALANYLKVLKINDERLSSASKETKKGIESEISTGYFSLGNVYSSMNQNTKALDYYFRSLKIRQEQGQKRDIAGLLGNIGTAFQELGDSLIKKRNVKKALEELYPKALNYYARALKLDEEFGNKNGTALKLGNIGVLYSKTADFLSSEKLRQTKYTEAEDYLNRALTLANSIGALNYAMNFEHDLSDLYSKTNRPALALEYYKKHISSRDSLFSEENKKKSIRAELNFEFEKKEAISKTLAAATAAIAKEESEKQKIIIWSVGCGLMLMIILATFIFRAYRQKEKANIIIIAQKREVEDQKEIVEEKQKEILDSIHYAKRIQTALLTSEKYIEKKLNLLDKK